MLAWEMPMSTQTPLREDWKKCRWCGRDRGVVFVEGPWGILFCSSCDFSHKYAAGPPIEHRVKDVP